MGHKTDGRRYKRPAAASAATKKISAARARSLVTRHLVALEMGKRGYAEADEALDELLAGGLAGKQIKLGDGSTAVIVDQFAAANKVFRAKSFSRFKLEVSEAS